MRDGEERRPIEMEVRMDDEQGVISGYAARFYDPSDPGTEFQIGDGRFERIHPEAFNRAIREDDVAGLFNHDQNKILGRSSAGTLRLSVDNLGLRYEITPPETPTAQEVRVNIKAGNIPGSSFAFNVRDQELRHDGDKRIREIRDVYLYDVGPVTFPAYTSTSTIVRSDAFEGWEEPVEQLTDAERDHAERKLRADAVRFDKIS